MSKEGDLQTHVNNELVIGVGKLVTGMEVLAWLKLIFCM